MSDLISRQAAIDAILAVTGNSSVRELYEHVQEHGLSEMWSGGVSAAIDIIIAVPSAQPDVPDTNVEDNGDTIYRQDAIDAVDKLSDEPIGYLEAAIDALVDLPSAQPEQKIGKFVRWMEKRETPDYISYTPHCKCSLCGNELLIENINYCYICGASLIEDREAKRKKE